MFTRRRPGRGYRSTRPLAAGCCRDNQRRRRPDHPLLTSIVLTAAVAAAVVPGLTTRQVITDPGSVATAVADTGLAEAGAAVSSAAQQIPDIQVPESVEIVPSIAGTQATTPPPNPDQ